MTTRIGIIIGSTRPNRLGASIGQWVHAQAIQRTDATFELIDLTDYNLPSTGHPDMSDNLPQWSHKVDNLDGFIVVTPEYNHSFTADLKRAIDALHAEWKNKAVGFVSYGGSATGARTVEQLRLVFVELEVASIRSNVTLPFSSEFQDNYTTFAPGDYQLPFLYKMFDQVISWFKALSVLRVPA